MAYKDVKKWKQCPRCLGEGSIWLPINGVEKKLACPRCPNRSGKIPGKD